MKVFVHTQADEHIDIVLQPMVFSTSSTSSQDCGAHSSSPTSSVAAVTPTDSPTAQTVQQQWKQLLHKGMTEYFSYKQANQLLQLKEQLQWIPWEPWFTSSTKIKQIHATWQVAEQICALDPSLRAIHALLNTCRPLPPKSIEKFGYDEFAHMWLELATTWQTNVYAQLQAAWIPAHTPSGTHEANPFQSLCQVRQELSNLAKKQQVASSSKSNSSRTRSMGPFAVQHIKDPAFIGHKSALQRALAQQAMFDGAASHIGAYHEADEAQRW